MAAKTNPIDKRTPDIKLKDLRKALRVHVIELDPSIIDLVTAIEVESNVLATNPTEWSTVKNALLQTVAAYPGSL